MRALPVPRLISFTRALMLSVSKCSASAASLTSPSLTIEAAQALIASSSSFLSGLSLSSTLTQPGSVKRNSRMGNSYAIIESMFLMSSSSMSMQESATTGTPYSSSISRANSSVPASLGWAEFRTMTNGLFSSFSSPTTRFSAPM